LGAQSRIPTVPAVLGYDRGLQFLHPQDAINVRLKAVLSGVQGRFNVAGDAIVLLAQAARRLGRPMLRLPSPGFTKLGNRLVQAMRSDVTSELARLLMYGRVMDTGSLREVFGYTPLRTTPETLDEFAAGINPGVFSVVGGSGG